MADDDPVEEFIAFLRERPELQARPGFKERLWARLLARIRTDGGQ